MPQENLKGVSQNNKQEIVEERAPLLQKIHDVESGFDGAVKASFYGSVLNLSCTIVGSGIMSLPATLKILGLVPGVILIVSAAVLAEASIEMLLRFSKPGSSFSYGDVMGEAFGTIGRILLQAAIIINSIGGLTVYMIIIGLNFTSSHSFLYIVASFFLILNHNLVINFL